MKNKKGLVILIVIVVLVLSSVVLGLFTEGDSEAEKKAMNSKPSIVRIEKTFGIGKDAPHPKIKKDYVAVLHIDGVISESNKTYNQKWLLKTIDNLKEDKKNLGILLFIDSPGGTVYEADEAYLKLLEYKKETDRPVYAYFASLAASGGYYIGCAAGKIFANRNTLTGSIGVICGSSVDATGLLDKMGIKSTTFTAGRNKNMLNYNSPLTEEQREIMQSVADDAYEQFTGIVAESRKKDIGYIKTLADGRIYTASQAKSNGLVDDICSLSEAKDKISEEIDFDGNFEDFKYEFEETFLRSLMNSLSFISSPKAFFDEVRGSASPIKLNYMAY